MKRTLTIVIAVAVIGTIAITGAFGGVSAQDDGVDLPAPSGGSDDPYDCGDFESVEQVRAVFADEYPGDESSLDRDDDDIPCEGQFDGQTEPVTPDTTTSVSTTEEMTVETTEATQQVTTSAPDTTTTVPETTAVPDDETDASDDAEGENVTIVGNATADGDNVVISDDVQVGEDVTIGASGTDDTSDAVESTAGGGNGKAKMGDGGDGDDTANGGNGKSKQD